MMKKTCVRQMKAVLAQENVALPYHTYQLSKAH